MNPPVSLNLLVIWNLSEGILDRRQRGREPGYPRHHLVQEHKTISFIALRSVNFDLQSYIDGDTARLEDFDNV